MGIAEGLAGQTVSGTRHHGSWHVLKRMDLPKISSGGGVSIGYHVRHETGRDAYMKASDLDLLTNQTRSMLERAEVAIQLHVWERKILDHCQGNNMDKVVTAIDYGDEIRTHNGIREPLFFLIFELAKCDARVQANRLMRFDHTWSMIALHNLAIAIRQLHGGEVSHNDIKPSNLLVFDRLLQKLGDLGSATSPSMQSIHDEESCPGDPRYAAPEILYHDSSVEPQKRAFEKRRAGDIFLLGSMTHFFITGVMVTPAILMHMSPVHRPLSETGGWKGSYTEVLPYWRTAYTSVLSEFESRLVEDQKNNVCQSSLSLLDVVKHLCEPNPAIRGHPLDRQGKHDQYSVERYISLFDNLKRKNMVNN